MALTTAAKVKAYANPELDPTKDAELAEAVARVSAWVPYVCGRPIEEASFTERFDGCRALGSGKDLIVLRPERRPVKHITGDLISVTEDGNALVLAEGYTTTAGVVVEDANEYDLPCKLRRYNQPWADGYGSQNITVVYKAGLTSAHPLWPALEALANEVAWLSFSSPNWLGKATVSRAGESTSWEKDLTPASRDLIRRLRAW